MKVSIITLDNQATGDAELNEAIFGVPVREDILHRVINWQLAKRRVGSHKTKNISEVSGTGKKKYRQKGTGNARHGSGRSNIFVGGAMAFARRARDYEHSLPKKVKKLGLKIALSAKQVAGQVIVIKEEKLATSKTKDLVLKLNGLGFKKALFICGNEVDENFKKALSNIKECDVLPSCGANVYDIIKHKELIITEAGLKALEERLA